MLFIPSSAVQTSSFQPLADDVHSAGRPAKPPDSERVRHQGIVREPAFSSTNRTFQLPTNQSPSPILTSWDSTYEQDLANHASNPSDTGTIWFSDSGAESKILSFLSDLEAEGLLLRARKPQTATTTTTTTTTTDEENDHIDNHQQTPTSFLDLGCGNGHLLLALEAAGWQGPKLGIDYSAHAIQLARTLAAAQTSSRPRCATLGFQQHDMLSRTLPPYLQTPFDVVLDKGTFDAISLSDDRDALDGRHACEVYAERVVRVVRPGGWLVVTSCNWTEGELRGWVEREGGFVFWGRGVYKRFRFGGGDGSDGCHAWVEEEEGGGGLMVGLLFRGRSCRDERGCVFLRRSIGLGRAAWFSCRSPQCIIP